MSLRGGIRDRRVTPTTSEQPLEQFLVGTHLDALLQETEVLEEQFDQGRLVPELDLIVASLNVDGASLMLFPLRDVQAMGAMNSTLGTVAHDAGAQLGIKVTSTSLFPGGSDHYPFVRQGIPALWIIAGNETGDPNLDGRKLTIEWMTTRLHTPKDDMSQPLDFGAAATHAKLNFLIGLQVAEAETRPRWNAGDFFGGTFGRR